MSDKRFVIGDDNLALFEVVDMEKEELVCECRAVDVEKIVDLLNEQQATISRLEEENDNMNLFIKQTIEPLLFNCVFELDTIESMSQVELARKIEDEIIPFIQDFKYLKYESPEEEKQDNEERRDQCND